MTIGEKIAKARKEAGMTQAALAEKLGVSSEAVSKWEQGKYEPGPENLSALAYVFEELGIPFWSTEGIQGEPRFFHEQHMSSFLKGRLSALGCHEALKALDYAKEKHEGQFRKGPGKVPYINHPLTLACHAMAMGLVKDELIAALLLHDVAEDCGVPAAELPFSPRVRELVGLVTKPDPFLKKDEPAYYRAIGEDVEAALIKCIDRCNNLSCMAMGFSADRIADYLAETEEWFPLLLQKVKSKPAYNNAAWLLTYQMRALLAMARRIG